MSDEHLRFVSLALSPWVNSAPLVKDLFKITATSESLEETSITHPFKQNYKPQSLKISATAKEIPHLTCHSQEDQACVYG